MLQRPYWGAWIENARIEGFVALGNESGWQMCDGKPTVLRYFYTDPLVTGRAQRLIVEHGCLNHLTRPQLCSSSALQPSLASQKCTSKATDVSSQWYSCKHKWPHPFAPPTISIRFLASQFWSFLWLITIQAPSWNNWRCVVDLWTLVNSFLCVCECVRQDRYSSLSVFPHIDGWSWFQPTSTKRSEYACIHDDGSLEVAYNGLVLLLLSGYMRLRKWARYVVGKVAAYKRAES